MLIILISDLLSPTVCLPSKQLKASPSILIVIISTAVSATFLVNNLIASLSLSLFYKSTKDEGMCLNVHNFHFLCHVFFIIILQLPLKWESFSSYYYFYLFRFLSFSSYISNFQWLGKVEVFPCRWLFFLFSSSYSFIFLCVLPSYILS